MKYRPFDPEKDKGKGLFELQSRGDGDTVETVYMPVDVEFELAAKTPWYYVVESD